MVRKQEVSLVVDYCSHLEMEHGTTRRVFKKKRPKVRRRRRKLKIEMSRDGPCWKRFITIYTRALPLPLCCWFSGLMLTGVDAFVSVSALSCLPSRLLSILLI